MPPERNRVGHEPISLAPVSSKTVRSLITQYLRKLRFPARNPTKRNFSIKEEYKSRTTGNYFEDSLSDVEGIVHQPAIYPFARFLAHRLGCSHIIDVGCGRAQKLIDLHPEFQTVGVDWGSNIQYCRDRYPFGTWIEWNLEKDGVIPVSRNVLKDAVIVCADVIEHLTNPLNLLKTLRTWLNDAPLAILTTPERDLVRGSGDLGPPLNPSHVREWNLPELEELLEDRDFRLCFSGLTLNNNRDCEKKTSIVLLENLSQPTLMDAPNDFRVVALMTAFNEEDIILPAISHLISQGVEVYLIDNWSTDATCDRAKQLLGQGLIAIEKFPPDAPPIYYEWKRLLGRVEELARKIPANWFMHHDADEIREAPWPGVRLKDAIYHSDRCGFNTIDHTVLVFHPIDSSFAPGEDLRRHFLYFELGKRPGHFVQIKAWKNFGQSISLADSGGHEVSFDARRIYPYKFLLRHYPIRSQAQGEKKVFLDRLPRFSPEERAGGWHSQYNSIAPGDMFLKRPTDLEYFEVESFCKRYLIERLSGIGLTYTPSNERV